MAKAKQLSQHKYLQALALFTMAHTHYTRGKEFETELGELLGYEDSYLYHISDEIFDGGDLKKALAKEGFTIAPKRTRK